MINKVSFCGLKGLSTPENKKNLEILSKLYGDDFFTTAEDVFKAIDTKSGKNEVFLKTEIKDGFLSDSMSFLLVDNKGKELAASEYRLGANPQKYGNKKGMQNALHALKVSFDEVLFSDTKTTGKLEKLINKYL